MKANFGEQFATTKLNLNRIFAGEGKANILEFSSFLEISLHCVAERTTLAWIELGKKKRMVKSSVYTELLNWRLLNYYARQESF